MKRTVPYLLALLPVFASALASAKEPPNYDASYASKAATQAPAAPLTASAAPRLAHAAFVASTDARRGVPTFLWAARDVGLGVGRIPGMTKEGAARVHLDRHAARYGLSREAMATARVRQIHDTGQGGKIGRAHV